MGSLGQPRGAFDSRKRAGTIHECRLDMQRLLWRVCKTTCVAECCRCHMFCSRNAFPRMYVCGLGCNQIMFTHAFGFMSRELNAPVTLTMMSVHHSTSSLRAPCRRLQASICSSSYPYVYCATVAGEGGVQPNTPLASMGPAAAYKGNAWVPTLRSKHDFADGHCSRPTSGYGLTRNIRLQFLFQRL